MKTIALEGSGYESLVAQAMEALSHSYHPYSGFAVGAALWGADGRVWTGCNIENAAFGPSICAERTAFFKAISEGAMDFKAIAIVGKKEGAERSTDFTAPCGVCRQVMAEFCPADFAIVLSNRSEEVQVYTLSELLPYSFQKTSFQS